eukprot:6718000-Prymnesium_polylepis.1
MHSVDCILARPLVTLSLSRVPPPASGSSIAHPPLRDHFDVHVSCVSGVSACIPWIAPLRGLWSHHRSPASARRTIMCTMRSMCCYSGEFLRPDVAFVRLAATKT